MNEASTMSNAEQHFLALCEDRFQTVEVPVGTKPLYVRRLKLGAIDEMEKAINAAKTPREKLLALLKPTLCDENGNLLLTSPERCELFNRMNFAFVKAIAKYASDANGLDQEADEGDEGK